MATLTYERWLKMPEASDKIEEIVDCEIQITPPPRRVHSSIIDRLNTLSIRLARLSGGLRKPRVTM